MSEATALQQTTLLTPFCAFLYSIFVRNFFIRIVHRELLPKACSRFELILQCPISFLFQVLDETKWERDSLHLSFQKGVAGINGCDGIQSKASSVEGWKEWTDGEDWQTWEQVEPRFYEKVDSRYDCT